MEEVTDIKDIKIYCVNNKQAYLMCCASNCKHQTFICGDSLCSCMKANHLNCKFVPYAQTVERIQAKKRQMSPDLKKAASGLEEIYDQAIDRLSRDRESVKIWRENYGIAELEYKFMQAVRENNREDLIGEFVFRVRQSLRKQPTNDQQFSLNWIRNLWDNKKYEFEAIFARMSKFSGGYNASITDLLADWRKNKDVKTGEEILKKLAIKNKWTPLIKWVKGGKKPREMLNLELVGKKCMSHFRTLGGPNLLKIEGLSCLINLRNLNLQGNNIVIIQNLQWMKLLTELNLGCNSITKIMNLYGLHYLETLYLYNNQIDKIQNLEELKCLKYVALFNNPAIVNEHTIVQEEILIQKLGNRGVNVKLFWP